MKKLLIVLAILAIVYLAIGLSIYLMSDPGVRGPIEQWLLGWPLGVLFYSIS